MPEIRPIKDLRNTTEISELCHKTKKPIFIIKNGYGDLVIMSMEICKRRLAKVDLYKKLAEAESQIKNEEMLLEAESVFQYLKEKHVKE